MKMLVYRAVPRIDIYRECNDVCHDESSVPMKA